MAAQRVAVIGAGIGGLVAALRLAHAGLDVTVLERAAAPGGKMRSVAADGARVEAGPTVFTMRWVFERDLFGVRRRPVGSREAEPGLHSRPPCLGGGPAPRSVRRSRGIGGGDPGLCRPPRGGRLSPLSRPRGRGLRHPGGPVHPGRAAEPHRPRPPGRPVGARRVAAHPALHHPVGGARRVLPRSAPAPIVRALRHLLRLLALRGPGDAECWWRMWRARASGMWKAVSAPRRHHRRTGAGERRPHPVRGAGGRHRGGERARHRRCRPRRWRADRGRSRGGQCRCGGPRRGPVRRACGAGRGGGAAGKPAPSRR